jgi:hypothetical protein
MRAQGGQKSAAPNRWRFSGNTAVDQNQYRFTSIGVFVLESLYNELACESLITA